MTSGRGMSRQTVTSCKPQGRANQGVCPPLQPLWAVLWGHSLLEQQKRTLSCP